MQTLLKHNVFIFFISIAIAMSMAPAGACDALSAKAGKKPCHTTTALEKVITIPAAGACHMTACPAKGTRLFLVPESPCRHLPDKNRSFVLLPAIAASPQMVSAPALFQANRFTLEQPLTHPPPLFCLFCVYIC